MNERIEQVRIALGLKRYEFAEKICISGSSYSKIVSGMNNPAERTIKLICTEFNVNEEWLRTGTGDMFVESDDDMIARIAAEYSLGPHGVALLRVALSCLETLGEERLVHILQVEAPALLASAPEPVPPRPAASAEDRPPQTRVVSSAAPELPSRTPGATAGADDAG